MKKPLKLGKETASLTNWMLSANSQPPIVGQGATELLWSDRHAYEVLFVSQDNKMVEIEELDATCDRSKNVEMGHQNWILTPSGRTKTLEFKRGKWKVRSEIIDFTKDLYKRSKLEDKFINELLTKEQCDAVFAGEPYPQHIIDGITRKRIVYSNINIIFGQKSYYYDWTF